MSPRRKPLLTVRISPAAVAALERAAGERGISRSELIEETTARYLDKRKGGQRGILLPPTTGPLVRCSFTVNAAFLERLETAESLYGLGPQDVVRAAIFDHLGEP